MLEGGARPLSRWNLSTARQWSRVQRVAVIRPNALRTRRPPIYLLRRMALTGTIHIRLPPMLGNSSTRASTRTEPNAVRATTR